MEILEAIFGGIELLGCIGDFFAWMWGWGDERQP
jgi:hypothetical protein